MRYYENLEKVSENRLPQRSYYIPGGEAEYTLLNGIWKFAYFEDVDYIGEIKKWDKIPVPSCWQLEGYDHPNYTNTNYPYPVDPPYVPMVNPAGVYERTFTVKSKIKQIYLVLEGVCSNAKVFVNGEEVGYTEGSRLQAEFDISEFVNKGKNTLRIIVCKWCVGSYLEDQDIFRFNGIFRDVYLLERPDDHIVDIDFKTEDNKKIVIDTAPETEITLFDGKISLAERVTDKNGHAEITVDEPKLWNAESPYLYILEFRKAGEIIRQKVGFRTIAISDKNELLINGTPVKLRGVNRHDSTAGGYVMTEEDMMRDLKLMKEVNVNCIRTSHYPPPPKFVEMCDEMGFYVVLETDIETHGFIRRYARAPYTYDVERKDWPCVMPEWKNYFVERMVRAYERDKNRTSIFMWSTGNESGCGENTLAMAEYVRSRDSIRLMHCEDASRALDRWLKEHKWASDALNDARILNRNVEACEKRMETAEEWLKRADEEQHKFDVFSMMYSSNEQITDWANGTEIDQPVYLCEYAHALGLSPGDIFEYMETFYANPAIIGGCIWEWCDHVVVVDGVPKYGGDFEGEKTHDGHFCVDGVVSFDRKYKTSTYEVKAAYAPLRIAFLDGKLVITNRYDFTDFADRKLTYSVNLDGVKGEKKEIEISLAPNESAEIDIGKLPEKCKYGCFAEVTLSDKEGNEIATADVELPTPKDSLIEEKGKTVKYTEDEKYIYASGKNFSYAFGKKSGNIDSIKVNGAEQLSAPAVISSFRAPGDNDKQMERVWFDTDRYTGENIENPFTYVYGYSVENGEILFNCAVAGISRYPYFKYTLGIKVYENGEAVFSLKGKVKDNCVWLPRLGFEFSLKKKNAPFTYYGLGPVDNYCDLCHTGLHGFYESTAEKEYVPYVYPQEHGNHIGVRELVIDGAVVFRADNTFEMKVSEFTGEQIWKAKHTDEIGESDGTHVRVDYKVSGIGSNAVGPVLKDCYRVREKDIDFKFSLNVVK